jgi:hypothetical protein
LAIVDPRHSDRYVLGVECDGRTYHQSKTARDRDRLRQEILEQQGWAIHRIWSTEWMRHPDHELQRVVAHVQSILNGDESPTPPDSGNTSDHGPDVDEPESLSPSEPQFESLTDDEIAGVYRTVELPFPDADMWETPLAEIAQAVIECVEVEGPIHQELLLRRIALLWGYQRAGSRIARHVQEATRFAVRRERIRQDGKFLWPARAIEIIPRGFAEDGSLRDIAHVPDEEIVQAVVSILERALSLPLDELTFRTSRVFGFQRTGRDIRERISTVVEAMIQSGSIHLVGDRVQIAGVRSNIPRQAEVPSHVILPHYGSSSDWTAPNS